MTEVFLLGVSHRSSPVALREKLAVSPSEMQPLVSSLARDSALDEALLISTCNRVEIYGVAKEPEGSARARAWLEARARARGAPDIGTHLYIARGSAAVRHAFRVASSLDSMVVGEPQILGQVKEAFAAAASAGTVGTLLTRCFHRAFAVAKRVRTETGIASGSVSVSSIACDLAAKIFEDLRGRRVLLIGAGKMGESAAKHLTKQGAKLYVLNRSRERAVELAAKCGGEPRGASELASELALADVAICSTSSDRFVVTVELMREVARARKYRPLFLIDIAVPRDVDPRVGDMENVFLYDVDDLSKLAEENVAQRLREAELAERIVEHEVAEFEAWRRQQRLKPLIVSLRAHVASVLSAEMERTLPRLGGDFEANREAMRRAVEAATNKLLHPVIAEVKRAAERGPSELLDAVPRLFDLELDVATRVNEPTSSSSRVDAAGESNVNEPATARSDAG